MYMIYVNPLSINIIVLLVAISFLSKSFDVTVCLCQNAFTSESSKRKTGSATKPILKVRTKG